ncbi:hypothetical protein Vretifemale_2725 [Volvox reticuliferus]|nr:hypothetical protein Vretifemale_2725 [Volvox reticuliferus]
MTPMGAPQLPSCTGITYPHRRPANQIGDVYDFTISPLGSGPLLPYNPDTDARVAPSAQLHAKPILISSGQLVNADGPVAAQSSSTTMCSPVGLSTTSDHATSTKAAVAYLAANSKAGSSGATQGCCHLDAAMGMAEVEAKTAAVSSDGLRPATSIGSAAAIAAQALSRARSQGSSRLSRAAGAALRHRRALAQPSSCCNDPSPCTAAPAFGTASDTGSWKGDGGPGHGPRATVPGITPPDATAVESAPADSAFGVHSGSSGTVTLKLGVTEAGSLQSVRSYGGRCVTPNEQQLEGGKGGVWTGDAAGSDALTATAVAGSGHSSGNGAAPAASGKEGKGKSLLQRARRKLQRLFS